MPWKKLHQELKIARDELSKNGEWLPYPVRAKLYQEIKALSPDAKTFNKFLFRVEMDALKQAGELLLKKTPYEIDTLVTIFWESACAAEHDFEVIQTSNHNFKILQSLFDHMEFRLDHEDKLFSQRYFDFCEACRKIVLYSGIKEHLDNVIIFDEISQDDALDYTMLDAVFLSAKAIRDHSSPYNTGEPHEDCLNFWVMHLEYVEHNFAMIIAPSST